MFFTHSTLCLLLVSLAAVTVSLEVESNTIENVGKQADLTTFRRLLDQVSPQALHAALHNFNPGKFKHGSFARDREAAEAVHQHDPDYASSMVILAKRQSDNTTTTVEPDPDISTSPSTEGLGTTAPSPGTSTQVVTEAPPPPSTVVVSITSSPPGAPLPAPNNNEPSAVAPGQTTSGTSSIPGESGPTSEETADTASTPVTEEATTSVRTGSRTSVVVRTTTLANGGVETVTAVTFVSGEPSATDESADDGSATSPSGSLQSEGVACNSRLFGWEIFGFVGGAIGLAFAL